MDYHTMNLLQETLEKLRENNKMPADVQWVGSRDGQYAITWDVFAGLANFEYDSGYGRQEIVRDLVVVGNDWWLERAEYDGSEEWEYKALPIKRPDAQPFQLIRNETYQGGTWWPDIEEMNAPKVAG